jgi:hypothetical protein
MQSLLCQMQQMASLCLLAVTCVPAGSWLSGTATGGASDQVRAWWVPYDGRAAQDGAGERGRALELSINRWNAWCYA